MTLRRAAIITTLVWATFICLDTRHNLSPAALWNETKDWWLLWPIWFGTMLFFTRGRPLLQRQAYLAGERAVYRVAAAAHGGIGPQVSCPRCATTNDSIAVQCRMCGTALRDVVMTHPLEALPGTNRTVPSLLYVAAVGLAFAAGLGVLMLIGEKRITESDTLMFGGFFAGLIPTLVLSFWAIGRWAKSTTAEAPTTTAREASRG